MTTALERLAAIPTANIGDAVDRLGLVDGAIRPVWEGARLAGPAFTCWTRAGDNLTLHAAVDEAAPGDIIVVNGAGDLSRALIGELLALRAKAKGIAGFVIDGAARDADGLQHYGMPVFARGITPAGPYKFGPGRLQVPIAVGGIAVLPGDLVIGDADGVAIVPSASADEVAQAAEAVQAHERQRLEGLERDVAAWEQRVTVGS
jgi:regulator of RNase E activity RraA